MLKRSLGLLVCLCAAWPQTIQAKKLPVLISKNLPAYSEFLDGFSKASGDLAVNKMQGDAAAGTAFLNTQSESELVIAIGPEAVACALQNWPGKTLVYSMVFQVPQYSGRSRGVLMQVSIGDQLKRVRELFPKSRRIGVVYDSFYSMKSITQAREICTILGLELEALPVHSTEEIGGLLEKLKHDKIDVLWSVLDRTTLAPSVITEQIKFGLSENIPFIGQSEYHVEAGALAAFSVDFASLGKQTARVANTMLREKGAGSAAPESPEDVIVYINTRTQKRLELYDFQALPNLRYLDQKK